jgi:NitT/TauT family transport system substrate-binding protein
MTPSKPAPMITLCCLALAGALLLSVVLGGCDRLAGGEQSSSATPSVTVAVNANYIGSGLLYLAEARGDFAREGIAVQFLPMTNGRDALEAVLDGRADFATAANTPLMFAMARGEPLAIVATLFQAESTHGILARPGAGIERPEDLAGRRIGVTLGTDGHHALDLILAGRGVALGSLQLQDLRPEDMAGALESGTVDAIATWEPWLGRAAASAVSRPYLQFMSPRGFPHGFYLAARSDVPAARPEVHVALLRALLRARDAAEQAPTQALDEMASAMGLNPAEMSAGMTRMRFVLWLSQGLLFMLEEQARWAQRNGLLAPGPLPDFLDNIHLDTLLAVDPYAVTVVR